MSLKRKCGKSRSQQKILIFVKQNSDFFSYLKCFRGYLTGIMVSMPHQYFYSVKFAKFYPSTGICRYRDSFYYKDMSICCLFLPCIKAAVETF